MNILLDSNAFLWTVLGSSKLGPKTRALIEEAQSVSVSAASIWELELKKRRKGLATFGNPAELSAASAIKPLSVTMDHTKEIARVRLPHGDAVDWMLYAQALAEGMQLVTADRVLLRHFPHATDARL